MATLARTLRPVFRCLRSQTRSYAEASGNEMKFTFAGANQVFYDNVSIRQVDVPSFSGSFGILPKHVPTLAVLKPGVVTVYQDDGSTKKVFVSSGTVTINEDSSVQILAEEAHPVENIDNSAARDILSKAQQQLNSASSDKDKAEAAIAVEVAEALVQASA
ncbi:ATP synthase subunit delta, mitochondrial [Microplitis mediator]|uniref:ATP synthase subunit delta, mitochondrial n=1 Tax=Microplitis demolitor TaxID=69319 RepID=UPI0004CCAAC6|nr:ATP synthase subunit delta, mitochondrial [Microplitis demolitor]XP_057326692.1 ATP synthase subunit delta, mitochondrial [Microplitis mediator]